MMGRESLTASRRRGVSHIAVGLTRRLTPHVAERWHQQYGDNPAPDKAAIQERLNALPASASRSEIDAIIGNETWTTEWCEVCETRVERWAILGQDDYGNGVNVCLACLKEAVVEVEGAA